MGTNDCSPPPQLIIVDAVTCTNIELEDFNVNCTQCDNPRRIRHGRQIHTSKIDGNKFFLAIAHKSLGVLLGTSFSKDHIFKLDTGVR